LEGGQDWRPVSKLTLLCYNLTQPIFGRGCLIPGRKPHKKQKIIQLLKDGETISVIIANKARCNVAYVNAVKNELLQEWVRSQKTTQ